MEPSSQDQDLVSALCSLYREIGGLHAVVARKLDVSTPQARLLTLLAYQQPSFRELAGLLGCDKTNVTGMVDRLQRRGLLRREPDAEDRRVSRVVITEAGRALAERLRAELTGAITGRLHRWPAADRRQLAKLAREIAEDFAGQR